MKCLYLMRHAKSSWKDLQLADHQRPLNKRGKHDALLMGKILKDKGVIFDAVFSSSAKRTRKTTKRLLRSMDLKEMYVVFDDFLYMKGFQKILSYIRDRDDRFENILIVGHNPSISKIISYFAGEDIRVPTGAIAGFEYFGDNWKDIDASLVRQILYEWPKKWYSGKKKK